MYKFKIKKILTIIESSISEDEYELDFALIEYNPENIKLYKEAISEGISDCWGNIQITEE